MPTLVEAPVKTAFVSGDIVVLTGDTITLGAYRGDDDYLIFPDDHPTWGGHLLLPDGVSKLLLPSQAGDSIPWGDQIDIYRKDPNAEYNPTGLVLNGRTPDQIFGPSTWQGVKGVTSVALGLQKD